MRHETPCAALATLERELDALEADVAQPGAGIEPRLDTVLTLIPVLGAAAQDPAYAHERQEALAAFQRLRDRQQALTARLEREMAAVREELTRLRTGAEATRGYGAQAAQRLDRVG